jgi:predicted nucleic acid-binding protein
VAAVIYLVDTSVWAKLPHAPAIRERLAGLLRADRVATCGVIDVEALFMARDARELSAVRRERRLGLTRVEMIDADFEAAMDVQEQLAQKGLHRAVKLPDLLIAAAARRAGMTVLHYDADYEHIAGVTRQPTEWIVPRGSVQ